MGGAATGAQGAAARVHGAARAHLLPSDTASSSGWSPPRQSSRASAGAQGLTVQPVRRSCRPTPSRPAAGRRHASAASGRPTAEQVGGDEVEGRGGVGGGSQGSAQRNRVGDGAVQSSFYCHMQWGWDRGEECGGYAVQAGRRAEGRTSVQSFFHRSCSWGRVGGEGYGYAGRAMVREREMRWSIRLLVITCSSGWAEGERCAAAGQRFDRG